MGARGIAAIIWAVALLPLPAAAQVGAWQLDGTVSTRGFAKDEFEHGAVLGIFEDGTYVTGGSLMCGAACEVGTWRREGDELELIPSNESDIALEVTKCLFGNDFIRRPNARLRTYFHVASVGPDGTLVMKSKARAQARFVFGWRSVKARGTSVATPTTQADLDRWVGDCTF